MQVRALRLSEAGGEGPGAGWNLAVLGIGSELLGERIRPPRPSGFLHRCHSLRVSRGLQLVAAVPIKSVSAGGGRDDPLALECRGQFCAQEDLAQSRSAGWREAVQRVGWLGALCALARPRLDKSIASGCSPRPGARRSLRSLPLTSSFWSCCGGELRFAGAPGA